MTQAELATIAQERIKLNIAIINNGYLGMVRQWQDLFHAKNYSEVKIGAPNFEKLAEAYGITGITVRSDAEIRPAIERARAIRGPVLIDFVIEPEANVWPIVPPGAANSGMLHQQRFEG
jgi:acetolactate synthase-1/2/3 large subunit